MQGRLGEVPETDHLRDEQGVPRICFGLTDIETADGVGLHRVDDLNTEALLLKSGKKSEPVVSGGLHCKGNLVKRQLGLGEHGQQPIVPGAVVGEGKDCKIVQYFTVSTGLGAGLVMDKKIYLGAHGFANEVANSIMMQDGPQIGNILPGGIEAISSGTAITERAKRAGLVVNHAGEVNDLAMKGNKEASEIMKDAKNYLANFIALIYGYADPDIVILGGSVALKIEGFVEEVENLVKEKVYGVMKPYVKVRKSTLNEDSGLIGAGYLAFSKEK